MKMPLFSVEKSLAMSVMAMRNAFMAVFHCYEVLALTLLTSVVDAPTYISFLHLPMLRENICDCLKKFI